MDAQPETSSTTEERTDQVEIKNPEAVYAKNKELLDKLTKLNGLKQFEGLDFNEVQDALNLKKSLREKDLIKKGDYDKAKEEFQKEFDKKYSALETEFNQFIQTNAYKSLQADLTTNGVRPEYADDVATILTAHLIEPKKRDGAIVWVNKDKIGDDADIKKILEGLREKKPAYFVANEAKGGGASGSNGQGGSGNELSKLPATERLSAIYSAKK